MLSLHNFNLVLPMNLFERFIFVLCAFFLVFIVITNAGKWYLMLFPDIERVRITGNFLHVDRLAVDKVINNTLQEGFFDLDIQSLEEQLEQIEWIHDVNIRRVWPGALHITVSEHQAIARWGDEALVSKAGTIFQPAQMTMSGLPIFYARPDRVSEALLIYLSAEQNLSATDLTVQAVYEDQRDSLSILVSNGSLLILGRIQHTERLQRFVQAYHSIEKDFPEQSVCVDLRYQRGFAIDPQTLHCHRQRL